MLVSCPVVREPATTCRAPNQLRAMVQQLMTRVITGMFSATTLSAMTKRRRSSPVAAAYFSVSCCSRTKALTTRAPAMFSSTVALMLS